MFITVIASLALGTYYRLSGYLNAQDLGNDEAANSFLTEYGSLKNYSKNHASYAPAYSVLRKFVVFFTGSSAKGHRLLSVVASLGGLFFLWLTLSRLLPISYWWLAIVLLAFSPNAIKYAIVAKQYSLDQFFYVLFFGLATLHFTNGKRNWVLYWMGILGTLCLWLSFASIFLIASLGLILLIRQVQKPRYHLPTLLSILTAWGFSFLLVYGYTISTKLHHPGHHLNWSGYFAPIQLWTFEGRQWLGSHIFLLFSEVARIPLPAFAVFFSIIGLARLWKVRWELACLITFPLVLTLIASMMRCYPFSGRPVSFFVPFLCICVGMGIGFLGTLLDRRRWGLTMLGCFVFLSSTGEAKERLSRMVHDLDIGIEKAISLLANKVRPDDYVLVRASYSNHVTYYMKANFDRNALLIGSFSNGMHVRKDYYLHHQSPSKLSYITYASWRNTLSEDDSALLLNVFNTHFIGKTVWVLHDRKFKEREIRPFLLQLQRLGNIERVFHSKKTLLYKFTSFLPNDAS